MELVIAASIGIVTGAVCAGLVHREELKWLRGELRVAHAQIAHAVIQDHAQVPARVEPVPEPEPLSKALTECIEQWEDADSRAVEEAKVRGYLAEGYSEKAVLKLYGVN